MEDNLDKVDAYMQDMCTVVWNIFVYRWKITSLENIYFLFGFLEFKNFSGGAKECSDMAWRDLCYGFNISIPSELFFKVTVLIFGSFLNYILLSPVDLIVHPTKFPSFLLVSFSQS